MLLHNYQFPLYATYIVWINGCFWKQWLWVVEEENNCLIQTDSIFKKIKYVLFNPSFFPSSRTNSETETTGGDENVCRPHRSILHRHGNTEGLDWTCLRSIKSAFFFRVLKAFVAESVELRCNHGNYRAVVNKELDKRKCVHFEFWTSSTIIWRGMYLPSFFIL